MCTLALQKYMVCVSVLNDVDIINYWSIFSRLIILTMSISRVSGRYYDNNCKVSDETIFIAVARETI